MYVFITLFKIIDDLVFGEGESEDIEEGESEDIEEGESEDIEEGESEDILPRYTILTDEPYEEASDFTKYTKRLVGIILNTKPRFTVGIFGGWGTGKTTFMQMMRRELEVPKYHDDVLVVWFDAWRYENEKYLTIIPLIRSIKVAIDNKVYQDIKSNKPISAGLMQLRRGVSKTFQGFAKSVNLNASVLGGGIGVDVEKFTDILGAEGSIPLGNETVYYRRQHITDYLKDCVKQFVDENKATRRIVVFIDDLDRCTPDKALELLESIKTFFDIEGIIYVVGMDPSSIDSIIGVKYGPAAESQISGLEYLQKIVQLPFSIPVWSTKDLSKTISWTILDSGIKDHTILSLLNETNMGLIIRSAAHNPRNIKRFINSIIISLLVYGARPVDVETLIAVQALYFRGANWVRLLQLLVSYDERKEFLQDFITKAILRPVIFNKKDLNDYARQYPGSNKIIRGIYEKITEIKDDDLLIFLKAIAPPLIKIVEVENYLRVLDPSPPSPDLVSQREVRGFERLSSLREYEVSSPPPGGRYPDTNGDLIHLPLSNLSHKKLNYHNLSEAYLFNADLSQTELYYAFLRGANLVYANLSGADLINANLSDADMSNANLTATMYSITTSGIRSTPGSENSYYRWTDLSDANLCNANLSSGKLCNANFQNANLSNANLKNADLSSPDREFRTNLSCVNLAKSDLTGADLSNANLSMADLSEANFRGANLSGADLSGSVLIRPENFGTVTLNVNTCFSNLVTDDIELMNNLGKDNMTSGHGPPVEIQNNRGLELRLRDKLMDENLIKHYLSISKLKWPSGM